MTTKILNLKLNNIGGFTDFEMTFHEKLTVLIGKNGSGKTTIVSSIATIFDMSLDTLIAHAEGKDIKKFPSYKFLSEYKSKTLLFGDRKKSKISAELNIGNETIDTVYDNTNTSFDVIKFIDKLIYLIKEGKRLPIFVYYPITNVPLSNVDFTTLEEREVNHPLSFYIDALRDESFDFNRFFNWFRWQENINKETGSKYYKIVREVISKVLSDEDNTYRNLHVTWQKKYNGDLCIEKNGMLLDMNQLSAGEKMLLVLTADLTRRLILANPKIDNPLQGNGIVLIDEIDSHLHPSWQRGIIPKLIKTFTNCQFIITTHSSSILADLRPENIFILSNFKAIPNTQHTLGRDNNSILSDIMEEAERPKKFKDEIEKLLSLIDDEKYEAARKKLDELEENLGPNDPDIVYTKSLLEFHGV